jgi:diguanylate cyclase (GGDEF)-like protein/PAS domain S-box-containing protein
MRGPEPFGRLGRGSVDGSDPYRRLISGAGSENAITAAASLALFGILFGASQLGLSAGLSPGGVSAVWPASGIAVAAVLLGGRRLLVAVALAAVATSASRGEPFVEALTAAAAAAAEAAIAFWLLRRVSFRETLRRTSDVVAFVGAAAIIGTGAGALIGALGLLAAGHIKASGLAVAWRDWWIGDASGVLIVGSAVLVFAGTELRRLRSRTAIELALLCGVVGVVSYELLDRSGNLPYLVLPLLFVLAFIYRQRGATVGAAIISTIAVVLTLRGHGPFAGGSVDSELIRALTFVCVGSVTGLLVAAAQSERRLAERAVDRLAESEGALAEAQRLARIGSFDLDLVSGRSIWSAELYRILGRSPESVPPGWQSWRHCVHPDDRALVDGIAERLYGERTAGSLVHRIVRPDGQVRTVEVRLRYELSSGGAPARVVGTCQDITAIKLAEDRFRALFEHAPYSIVVVDEQGRVALGNLQARQMFGYTRGEIVGMAVEDLIASPAGSGRPWYERPTEPVADVEWMGAAEFELRARRRDGEEFPVEVSLTPLETEEGQLVSAAIRDVTELRATAAALSFQARHDALTGLPNRMMFLERLEQALARADRSGRPLAVVFLDLDDFKLVNDTSGHEAGDELLRQLTPRLNTAVRLGDTIARLGGDEFVVLCEDMSDEADAIEIAQRVADAAVEPFEIGGSEHAISISAGVVIVAHPSGSSAHSVLRDADAAMYAAKAGGKGRVSVFDESMRERLLERVAVESSLRGAVQRGELELAYQPVVSLMQSRRVVGVEALLRWRHPIRGLLPPAEFVPIAERSGLIAEIGEWVIEEACRQAASWRELAGPLRAVPVSVNISPVQLTRGDLAAAVARTLRQTGLPAELLELEVTESTLLEDVEASQPQLRRLKALGVRLVVDDFGTGYSSLSALRNLMIDGLKLDRSFVVALAAGDEDEGSMMDAVLSMAEALDAEVTAEGVETWAQANRLRMHGCDYVQGYLFARPGPASEVTELLADGLERGRGSYVG